jgi:phosphoribosylglycinamide formyltransferase-1
MAKAKPKPKPKARPIPKIRPVPKAKGKARAKTGLRDHPILRQLSKICLSLPEAARRVRGKVFAYFLNNHHGDGIISVCCKSALGENVDRASREPKRFYLPPYIGPRGWFGLRLDGEGVDWSEVRNLVELSYGLVAPKRLLRKK